MIRLIKLSINVFRLRLAGIKAAPSRAELHNLDLEVLAKLEREVEGYHDYCS